MVGAQPLGVHWLRRTYGLPASVIPPFWHHHPELLWELSALHLHWLCSYDSEKNGSAPFVWHRDFADARLRLRDWVAGIGTRLDRDRPTRQTAWPGEPPAPPVDDTVIEDRETEFVEFVYAEVAKRRGRGRRLLPVTRSADRGSLMTDTSVAGITSPLLHSRDVATYLKCQSPPCPDGGRREQDHRSSEWWHRQVPTRSRRCLAGRAGTRPCHARVSRSPRLSQSRCHRDRVDSDTFR